MPQFTSPPNPQAFYAQVWEIARQIPRGKVASYGQIAKMLPPPEGVEIETYIAFGPLWVGGAMAHCPDGVPWQRVINSKGEISERDGAGARRQTALFALARSRIAVDTTNASAGSWRTECIAH